MGLAFKVIKLQLICLLTISLGITSIAQDLYSFEEQSILFENRRIPVAAAYLETDEVKVQKAIIKYLEDEMEIRFKKSGDHFKSKEGRLFPISDRSGCILLITECDLTGVNVYVGAQLGIDLYVNSENFSIESKNMYKLLNRFSYGYMLGEVQKKYKSYKKDLHKNQKTLKKSQNKIKKYDAKTDKLQKNKSADIAFDEDVAISEPSMEIAAYKTSIETENVISTDVAENIKRLEPLVHEYRQKYLITKNRNKLYSN